MRLQPVLRSLPVTLLCLLALLRDARAAVSETHDNLVDYDDWQEQRGYNPERDLIVEIGNWNRREIEGYWPETEYSFYEWLEVSDYYVDEDDADEDAD